MSEEIKDEKLAEGSEQGLPPNFSQMLDKVLANPEIITAVASALSQAPPKAEGQEQPEEPASAQSSPSPDIAAMAQKLPEVIKLLSPLQGDTKKEGGGGIKGAHSSDNRTCLLNAMKPYMSKQRCEAIDYIVGFSRIADVLKHLK